MIRPMKFGDLDQIAGIWLDSNITAHNFLPKKYWEDQFPWVKHQIAQAQVFVAEEAGKIEGFIGLDGDEIEGLFVRAEARGRGVGSSLLNNTKNYHRHLSLYAYQKNQPAVRFYQAQGFKIAKAGEDPDTGESDYLMIWDK